MQGLFKWGKSTFALIPGLLVIFYNLWVPSEISRWFLGGFMEAVGIFTLFIFYQQRKKLSHEPWTKLRNYGLIYFILFILSLLTYIFIYGLKDIYNSKYDTSILIPFWENNDLQYMLTKTGSTNNAILTYGPEAIRNAINNTKWSVVITEIIFIVNYILIFEFLILGFGYIAVKNDKE